MKSIPIIVGALLSCLGPTALATELFEVFILAGQSNLEGRAHQRDLPPELARPHPDILLFYNSTWEPLAPGSSRRPAPPDGFGPEITFGRALSDAPGKNRRIALIKHARGGTSLAEDWDPETGPLWATLNTKVHTAMEQLRAQGYHPVLRSFIWMQGERDATTLKLAHAYEKNLTHFLHALRHQYSPDLPVIMGRINAPEKPHRKIVRHAQQSVADTIPHIILINTDDLPLLDQIHYDSAGLQELGRRFAKAALDATSSSDR